MSGFPVPLGSVPKERNALEISFLCVFEHVGVFKYIFPSIASQVAMSSRVLENGTQKGFRVPKNGTQKGFRVPENGTQKGFRVPGNGTQKGFPRTGNPG